MTLGKVNHVDIVANAGAVRCVVVIAEDMYLLQFPLATCAT
jgi:hypothetical protein